MRDYNKNKDSKNVLTKAYSHTNEEIFFLSSGKKKKIILQALKGYFKIFGLRDNYQLLDLYRYENKYIKFASIMEKLKLKSISRFLYKYGCKLIYEKFQNDLNTKGHNELP